MWWKQNRGKVLALAAILAVLAASFWYGGDAPGLQGLPEPPVLQQGSTVEAFPPDLSQTEIGGEPDVDENFGSDLSQPVGPAAQDPVPEPLTPELDSTAQTPAETEPPPPDASEGESQQDPILEPPPAVEEPGQQEFTCTLSVGCHSVFEHLDWLAEGKAEILPDDGWIFPETQVAYTPGESVFDLLQREMKTAGIPMEFSETPMYQSVYIEGISNLYEFDCGELSGWLYLVNGEQFSYGASRRQVEAGDKIQWVYTCDRGLE